MENQLATMKRAREQDFDTINTMARFLMLFSNGGHVHGTDYKQLDTMSKCPTTRIFQCKTCNKQFPSFQALGGHRASHKKPRLATADLNDQSASLVQSLPAKPKTHECSICGLEFSIGQALGGHMRRHRAMATSRSCAKSIQPLPFSSSTHKPVLVKKAKSRRVLCLDLNLAPPSETAHDLEFQIGKVSSMVHCYL